MSEEKRYQAIIDELWPKLKKKHLYPELPIPKVGEETSSGMEEEDQGEAVGLEIKQKQIIINPAFISRTREKMTDELVIEALLDHGITHYTFCPWDFHTHLMLYAEAKKVMGDKELAKQAADYFIDVTADTHCVKKKFTDIPELHRVLKKREVEKVIASLYEKIWGIDLGISESKAARKGCEEIVRRLARIPYLDRSRWKESMKKFARSLKPLLLEEQKEQEATGGKGDSNPQGDHDLNSYSYEEIDQGLRDFAKQTMALPEFKDIIEDFSEELKEAGYGMEGGWGGAREPRSMPISSFI